MNLFWYVYDNQERESVKRDGTPKEGGTEWTTLSLGGETVEMDYIKLHYT